MKGFLLLFFGYIFPLAGIAIVDHYLPEQPPAQEEHENDNTLPPTFSYEQ